MQKYNSVLSADRFRKARSKLKHNFCLMTYNHSVDIISIGDFTCHKQRK